MRKADPNSPTKEKLLDATRDLMMRKGFAATSVDDICRKAGVTNGSFFHFFPSKDAVTRASVVRFIEVELDTLRSAAFQHEPDPVVRLHGWIDAAIAVFEDPESPKSCLLGTLTQELAPSSASFQALFATLFSRWAEGFARDAAEAAKGGRLGGAVDSSALGDLYLSLIQGSIILGKGRNDARIGAKNLRHFKDYITTLFRPSNPRRQP